MAGTNFAISSCSHCGEQRRVGLSLLLPHNAAVLCEVADIAGLPIFTFCFNFMYFFHQLVYAVRERSEKT